MCSNKLNTANTDKCAALPAYGNWYQEKSYTGKAVLVLLEKSYPGTTSPGEIVLINIRVRVFVENLYPSNLGYDFSLWTTLSFFSHEILDTTSSTKKLSVIKSRVRLLLRKNFIILVLKSLVQLLIYGADAWATAESRRISSRAGTSHLSACQFSLTNYANWNQGDSV
jgi:hypothetical protein